MQTPWADTLDRAQPLPEYPRPQMVRDSYLNLNGPWSYAITTSAQKPAQADGTILVPFSPESELSGVGHILQPEEYLWYIRTVTLPDGFNIGRVLLHFGAVDQTATVWCNGVELATHTGGYLPFTVDITEVLAKEHTILVCVRDATNKSQLPRGKQTLHPHGIWYTPQSGIWQTVWLESVPQNYIRSLRVTPLFDAHQVEITVEGEGQCTIDLEGRRYTFPAGVPALVAGAADALPLQRNARQRHGLQLLCHAQMQRRDGQGRRAPPVSQRQAVFSQRAARSGLLAGRALHRAERRRARLRHPAGQGYGLQHAAQAHQGRVRPLVLPL